MYMYGYIHVSLASTTSQCFKCVFLKWVFFIAEIFILKAHFIPNKWPLTQKSLTDIWWLNGQNQWLVNDAKERMGNIVQMFQPFKMVSNTIWMATEKFQIDNASLFVRHRKNFQPFNFGRVMPAVQMANKKNWMDDASHANGWQKILYGCCQPLERLTNNFKWVMPGIWTANERNICNMIPGVRTAREKGL